MALVASASPAAPAAVWRKLRRVKSFFMADNRSCNASNKQTPRGPKLARDDKQVRRTDAGPKPGTTLLLCQRLDGDFLEENDVVVAVVLQADPANHGPTAAPWLEVELFRRD